MKVTSTVSLTTRLVEVSSRHQRQNAGAANQLSFRVIESSMYKRRRLAQPALPRNPGDVDNVLLSTRFAQLNGSPFYRGLSDPDDIGSSSIFCTG